MTGRNALDLLAVFLTVATVYVLVRPRSKGSEFVKAVSFALTAIVSNAVDLAGG